MDKKKGNRRPGEKPAEQGSGTYAPNRPEPGRKTPEAPDDKGFGKPEGQPIDKQMPNPQTRARRDILESERSDRESGRPVQLDDEADEFDDEAEEEDRGQEQKPSPAGKTKR
jgi:hypothetical protein